MRRLYTAFGIRGARRAETSYDGLGRVITTSISDSSLGGSFNPIGADNSARITTQLRYDSFNNILSDSTSITGVDASLGAFPSAMTSSKTYRGRRVETLSTPSGKSVIYSRDSRGRLIHLDQGGKVADLVWGELDKLKRMSFRNGAGANTILVQLGYYQESPHLTAPPTDERTFPAESDDFRFPVASKYITRVSQPEFLAIYHRSFDDNQRLLVSQRSLELNRNNVPAKAIYQYISTGELLSAHDTGRDFEDSVDPATNVTPRSADETQSPGNADNSLSYALANGFLFYDGRHVNVPDALGRICEVWDSGSHKLLSFHYDGLGRRVLKIHHNPETNDTVAIRYGYDGQLVVTETWQRRTSTGSVYSEDTSADILHGPEGPLEVTVYRPRANGFNGQAYSRSVMVNHDPEGRPVLFINPDGSVAQKHYYAPNGRLVRTEDPDYAQVPHEAIIPLEFQAGGGFRDLETAPRSASAKHFHLTVGGYVTSGMVYLGLDLSREQQEAFGGAINAAPGKIYDCTVSIAKFLRNLTAGALDGLAHGFTGGLYEGQLAGTYLGAEVDSAAYLTGHVVASFVGPIALSMAAGGIGNPWLLRAAIAVDVMGIIDGIHKRSVLGVVGGLIGLRMGVKAYRSAMSSVGRMVALEALENGVERGRKISGKLIEGGAEQGSIQHARALASEAAELHNIHLKDYVDEIRIGGGLSIFGIDNGVRFIRFGDIDLNSPHRARRLLAALHELEHAKQFRRDGGVILGVPRGYSWRALEYAVKEVSAEATARAILRRKFGRIPRAVIEGTGNPKDVDLIRQGSDYYLNYWQDKVRLLMPSFGDEMRREVRNARRLGQPLVFRS